MNEKQKMLRTPQFWIGLVISLICIVLLLTQVPLGEILPSLSGGNYWWIIPAVIFQLISIALRASRWQLLLRGKATYPIVFWAQGIGYLFTNIFPLRMGEPARILILSQKSQIPIAETAATAIVERVFDVATILFLLTIVLPFMDISESIIRTGQVLGILAMIAFFGLLASARFPVFFTSIIERVLSPIPKIRDIILPIWENVIAGLETIKTLKSILSLTVLSFMVWSFSIFAYWAGIKAFMSNGNLIEATFMVVAISLAITVPSSPGFIGVFQFVAERALVLPFGDKYSSATALSIALASYLVYYFTSTGTGLVGMWQFGNSIKDILNNILNRSQSKPSKSEN